VELLCKQHNIEVRYIDQLDAKTESSELTEDLLSVLTHYTAKASGQKTRKLYGVQISEDVASLIFDWRSQKLSTHRIAAKLKQENKHLDANGRPITHTVLYKFLKRNGSVGRKLLRMKAGAETSSATPVGDSLVAFTSQCVLKNELGPNGKPAFTRFTVFYNAYDAFCDQHGLIAHSRYVVPKHLRNSGFKLVTRRGYLGIYAAMRSDAKLSGVAEAQICQDFSGLHGTSEAKAPPKPGPSNALRGGSPKVA
jgi:hypothetical protein